MKQFFLAVAAIFFLVPLTSAQKSDLYVKSGDKGLYIEHKVAAKESFFALGRMYNVYPKSIATFNKIDYTKGLAIGQLVRIPLTDTNFTQKGNSGTPLYYKTGENEGLMKVSGFYKNVTLENLRRWNGLSDNSVAAGRKLVVGFLLSKEMPSVVLNPATTAEANVSKNETVTTPVETKTEEVVAPAEIPVPPVVESKKETPKVEPVVQKTEDRTTTSQNGYFKSAFDQQVKVHPLSKNSTVTSGIFKTTSGWVDGKYYLLIDGVQPGTILKVTNPSNDKIIFAKVLGEMSGIRQNEGLNIRLSSAAASALSVTEQDKFIVRIVY